MGDGIVNSSRVNNFTTRGLEAKVVDNILNTPIFAARMLSNGKPFKGKDHEITLKLTNSNRSEWFTGLETLNSTGADTTATIAFNQSAMHTPVVSVMLESFANDNEGQEIDLDQFNLEESEQEARAEIGSAIFGTGSGDQCLGLEALVDDGTNVGTIGGLSRTTYTQLKSTVTASSGSMTLAKLGALHDSATSGEQAPTIHVTTKNIWTLYETTFLDPQVRAGYEVVGYPKLPVKGQQLGTGAELKGGTGFTAVTFRGRPIISDDNATSGVFYSLNENYIFWVGRHRVPKLYEGKIRKVDFGQPKTYDGAVTMPSKYNGFFFQDMAMLPNQAGMVGRFYIIGQFVCSNFKRQAKLTGITSAA